LSAAGPVGGAVPATPDGPALAEVLSRHGVRYVVIGGFVAQTVLPGYETRDIDFTPATDRDNLDRLSLALHELGARIRTDAVAEGLPFSHSGESLAKASMWNLQCKYGAFDITFEPAGGGYDHLVLRAKLVTIHGVEVPVAALVDVVRSKELANRPKDLATLPQLLAALEREGLSTPAAAPGPVDEPLADESE